MMVVATAQLPGEKGNPVHIAPGKVILPLAVMVFFGTIGPVSASGLAQPGTSSKIEALVTSSVKITKIDATVASELPSAASDNASRVYGIPSICDAPTSCVYGDTSSTKTVVLFGDSHARMWLPAILPRIVSEGMKLVIIGQDGCPIALLSFYFQLIKNCGQVVAQEISTIVGMKPVSIILSEDTVYPGYPAADWRSGITRTLRDLHAANAKLVMIGDIQSFSFAPIACLATYPTMVQKCSTSNPDRKVPSHVGAERAASRTTKTPYLDPTPWLCTHTRCSSVIGNFIAYWDYEHVSATYAGYLSSVMGSALKPHL